MVWHFKNSQCHILVMHSDKYIEMCDKFNAKFFGLHLITSWQYCILLIYFIKLVFLRWKKIFTQIFIYQYFLRLCHPENQKLSLPIELSTTIVFRLYKDDRNTLLGRQWIIKSFLLESVRCLDCLGNLFSTAFTCILWTQENCFWLCLRTLKPHGYFLSLIILLVHVIMCIFLAI